MYQIYGDNTAWCIGSIATDDGCRNKGNYEMVWQENGVEIAYYDEIEEKQYRSFFEWAED